MTARPRVLVAARSDTLALRLRLMIEAEGGDAVMVDGATPSPGDAVAAVAVPAAVAEVGAAAPGVPVIEVQLGQDWDELRRRLAQVLAPRSAITPPSEADALAAALASARILLVDDSVTYREFLRMELSRLGASVVVCPDPQRALELLERERWDCLLVDLVMPGMDGAQLCALAARLRRERRRNFAIVVLSSREGNADLMRCLEAGADLFLAKSQDVPLLRVKLGAALRHRQLG